MSSGWNFVIGLGLGVLIPNLIALLLRILRGRPISVGARVWALSITAVFIGALISNTMVVFLVESSGARDLLQGFIAAFAASFAVVMSHYARRDNGKVNRWSERNR